MKKLNIILLLPALICAVCLHAQEVTLKTPDMTVEPGTNLHLDLQVEDFEQIVGMQFSINWDPAVIEFIALDNLNSAMGLSSATNFNIMEAPSGKLRFVWEQFEFPVTLDDMSPVFGIWFKAIGPSNSSTEVAITDDPITIEVINLDTLLPVNIENGTITVQSTSAVSETRTTDFTLFQNSPNPFTDITNIRFSLNKSTEASLSIYDNSGKVVFEKTGYYPSGIHSIPVKRNLFQSAGTYLYSLKTADASATRQLIAQ